MRKARAEKSSTQADVSALLVGVFRLNGALLLAGDRIVSDLGITGARWQVIGVVSKAVVPLSVAAIARKMDLTRQTVRGLVAELVSAGLVRFEANPDHRRARLVLLTEKGVTVHKSATARQVPWFRQLGENLRPQDVRVATELLQILLQRLNNKS